MQDELDTPPLLLSPENAFFGTSIGNPADVWTLACTLHEMLGERSIPHRDDTIAELKSYLGPSS